MLIARLFLVLGLLALSSAARADYAFLNNGGYGSLISNQGEILSPLAGREYENGPAIFIDEHLQSIEVGHDGAVYVIGNSLGTLTLHRFDPQSGIETEPYGVSVSVEQQSSWNIGWPRIGWLHDLGSEGALVGRIGSPISIDGDGGVWSIGQIEHVRSGPGGFVETVYGWGVNRYQFGSDEPPLPVLQATSGEIFGEYGNVLTPPPVLDVVVRPSDSRVFISTIHGLLDLGVAGVPSPLYPGSVWGPDLAARVADASHPLSPFNAAKPWMHPGAVGGGWEFGPDGLLWRPASRPWSEARQFERYDVDSKSYAEPIDIEGLADVEGVTDWFFDDRGNLLLLTNGETRPASNDVFAPDFVMQRLHEIDVATGQHKRTIFEMERLDNFGFSGVIFTQGVYIPSVPEPTAATFVALSVLAVCLRRANLAVR